jgi:ssDNA-binding replication factor A large subunit
LVCVKSIGGKKKISRKDGGGESELAEVMLFDHTGEVRLTVWNEMIESAKSWKPGETVLLISNPGYRVGFNGKGNLAIIGGTMVDVQPEGRMLSG